MAETQTVTQYAREAPEIEARKLALMDAARQLAIQGIVLPPQMVAGFTPDQLMAMQLTRQGLGGFAPYLKTGAEAIARGVTAAEEARPDIGRGMALTEEAAGVARTGLPSFGEAQQLARQAGVTGIGLGALQQAAPQYGEAQQIYRQAMPQFGGAYGQLGQAGISGLLSTQAFRPEQAQAFYDPFEQQVVQQTLRDIEEQTAQQDIARRAQAVSAGAFGGARSRLLGEELQRAAGRGAAEAVAGIRSAGFGRQQQAAQQAFEAQQARQAGLAALQAQLGQQYGQLAQVDVQTALQRAAGLGDIQAQQAAAKLAQGQALNQAELMKAQQALAQSQQLAGMSEAQAAAARQQAGVLGGLGQQAGQLGLGAAEQRLRQAQALGQLGVTQIGAGEAAQALAGRDIQSLATIGAMGQQQAQNVLEAQRASQMQQLYEPYQRLGFVSDIYRGAPTSQQMIQTSTTPSASPFQQVAGLGIAALGAAGAAKQLGLFGA